MAATAYAADKQKGPQSVVHLAWASYKKQLIKRPLPTKAITSACVASLSDIIAQRLVGTQYSLQRTLKMALWGLLIGAPSAHFWHYYLQKWFARKADNFETVIQKVILDQLTFGPAYNLAFMSYTAMVVHKVPPTVFKYKLAQEFPTLQLNGWKVWPLVSLINYRYIPVQFRVLFANVVALFWGVFVITRSRSAAAVAPPAKRYA